MTLTLELIALGAVQAQAPTGTIAGRITDPTGAAIPGARIVVTNKQTRAQRALVATNQGDYSAPALLAGLYEVTAEAPTTVNLTMQLGATTALQVTAWLAPLGVTVAVNCWTPPAITVALAGETVTPPGGGGGGGWLLTVLPPHPARNTKPTIPRSASPFILLLFITASRSVAPAIESTALQPAALRSPPRPAGAFRLTVGVLLVFVIPMTVNLLHDSGDCIAR